MDAIELFTVKLSKLKEISILLNSDNIYFNGKEGVISLADSSCGEDRFICIMKGIRANIDFNIVILKRDLQKFFKLHNAKDSLTFFHKDKVFFVRVGDNNWFLDFKNSDYVEDFIKIEYRDAHAKYESQKMIDFGDSSRFLQILKQLHRITLPYSCNKGKLENVLFRVLEDRVEIIGCNSKILGMHTLYALNPKSVMEFILPINIIKILIKILQYADKHAMRVLFRLEKRGEFVYLIAYNPEPIITFIHRIKNDTYIDWQKVAKISGRIELKFSVMSLMEVVKGRGNYSNIAITFGKDDITYQYICKDLTYQKTGGKIVTADGATVSDVMDDVKYFDGKSNVKYFDGEVLEATLNTFKSLGMVVVNLVIDDDLVVGFQGEYYKETMMTLLKG